MARSFVCGPSGPPVVIEPLPVSTAAPSYCEALAALEDALKRRKARTRARHAELDRQLMELPEGD